MKLKSYFLTDTNAHKEENDKGGKGVLASRGGGAQKVG